MRHANKRCRGSLESSDSSNRSLVDETIALTFGGIAIEEAGLLLVASDGLSARSCTSKPIMPVAAGSQQAYKSHLPPYSTAHRIDAGAANTTSTTIEGNDAFAQPKKSREAALPELENDSIKHVSTIEHKHEHRDSNSTEASDSTDSSPTTTISTVDSTSLTEHSPASSPESPMTILPLSSFQDQIGLKGSTVFQDRILIHNSSQVQSSNSFVMPTIDDLVISEQPLLQRPAIALSAQRPMTSPSPRRFRNQKGLALNLLNSNTSNSSSSDIPSREDNSLPSTPSSVGFVMPPKMKARKKPSQLSLQTCGQPPTLGRLQFEPPPTPSGSTLSSPSTLRHAQSTPQLFSPAVAPIGGMQLPAFRSKPAGLSKLSFTNSSIAEELDANDQIFRRIARLPSDDKIGGDPFDRQGDPTDQAGHENDYPDGPACIFEPSVFLYKEPTAQEAAKFDVVINVASEVRNPFMPKPEESEHQPLPAPRTTFGFNDSIADHVPEPSTAMSTATFHSAMEWPLDSQRTPTQSPSTPRPASSSPEYIHLPWEHHTDNVKDLLQMVEVMDTRVKSGKSVLVHCQQGISRSASLIIAYAIYLDPSLNPDQAHDLVKSKSPWISPNMRLVYQIQDFKAELLKRRATTSSRIKHSGRSPTRHKNTLSANGMELSNKESLTAPLDGAFDKEMSMLAPNGASCRRRGHSTPNFGDITPGPSSAPSSYAWPQAKLDESTKEPIPHSTILSNDKASTSTVSFAKNLDKASHQKLEMIGCSGSSSSANRNAETIGAQEVDSDCADHQTTRAQQANPFAGFDFGFRAASEPPRQESIMSTEAATIKREGSKSSLSGSFPSPGADTPRWNRSPGFGSHRQGLQNNPSLPVLSGISSGQPGMPGVGGCEQRQSRYATAATQTDISGPLSPALFSPRVQETMSPLAKAFGKQSIRQIPQSIRAPIEIEESTPLSPALFSPRVQQFTANPLDEALDGRDLTPPARHPPPPPLASHQDDLEIDGLMSPRAAEFGANIFAMPVFNNAQDAAASFGFATSPRPSTNAPLPTVVDPRSPPTKGEVPIIRSIDDVL